MQLTTEEPLVHEAKGPWIDPKSQSTAVMKTPEDLANIVSQFAASSGWLDRVRLRTEHRWYERLSQGLDHDIWAISWMPG